MQALARYMQMYRDTAERYGWQAGPDNVGWAIPTYCAETDEIAKREAKPHIEFFFNKLLRMPQEMLLPPGYLSLASMQGVMAAKRTLVRRRADHRRSDGEGDLPVRQPGDLREKLEQYQAQIGFGYLLADHAIRHAAA